MAEIINLADNKRVWHQNFIDYTEFIVTNPIYKGLYFERGSDNRVKWVITGKSENGKERRKWWDEQCVKNGIAIEAGCYAKIALKIHPTKIHICQICGKGLSLEYVYPNRRTIAALMKEFNVSIIPFSKNIFQIVTPIQQLLKAIGETSINDNVFYYNTLKYEIIKHLNFEELELLIDSIDDKSKKEVITKIIENGYEYFFNCNYSNKCNY